MNPLKDPPRPQGQLSRAPLERVVCQVKFPLVLSIANQGFIGGFQELIREKYPQASLTPGFRIQMNIPGLETPFPAPNPTPVYRFEDEGQLWRVSLTQDSISLDTKAYKNRDEFLGRLGEIIRALEGTVKPTRRSRIGIRYINRIKDPGDLSRLQKLFRPEILGVASSLDMNGQILQMYSEALINTPVGRLYTRWGRVPSNSTYEPVMVPPLQEESWMLDIDASNEEIADFNTDTIMQKATALSERVCAFFQWSITDDFVSQFR